VHKSNIAKKGKKATAYQNAQPRQKCSGCDCHVE